MKSQSIDLDEVQSLVLRGYRVGEAHPLQYYGYLALGSQAPARRWLAAMLPHITTCATFDRQSGPFVLNIALSYRGLMRLGAPRDCAWPQPLVAGMAQRADILGDLGDSAPSRWDDALGLDEVDAVVSVAGPDEASIREGVAVLKRELGGDIALLGHDDAAHLPGQKPGTEHFGFVDGIGQPYVEGSGLSPWPGEGTPIDRDKWAPIKAGEFVLGYRGEQGSTADQIHPFLANGSYFALRKLSERVAAFRDYVAEIGKLYATSPEAIAAKMVGRWQSGAPLVLAPERDDAALGADPSKNNNFHYAQDPKGHACAFGAHIRRANPREDPTGPTIAQVRRHRIIRRALPYGPWLPEGSRDDIDRGVMFGVINADIENQFEYVQRNWMNASISSRALSIEADKDPLVGAQDGTGKLLIPGRKGPAVCWDLPRFVQVKAGAYFFVPSRAALASLAEPS